MLEGLQRRVEAPGVAIHGGMSGHARKLAAEQFQMDPRCRVLIGTRGGVDRAEPNGGEYGWHRRTLLVATGRPFASRGSGIPDRAKRHSMGELPDSKRNQGGRNVCVVATQTTAH